ncbi:BQ2448_6844 [Microbotryum intermedium]|uniref:Dipeptidyl peptidase 3 n=1 Tax=Microbotryum intermedium TaxID=269621 RepID=A0A238FKV5_9BASI|nr:BQ2448_6844 [Microbotryum intermedium]
MASTSTATTTASSALGDTRFLADQNPPVCSLGIGKAFQDLTKEEKLYSHHLSLASWAGARIIMAQTSPHAEAILDLIIALFSSQKNDAELADLQAMKDKSQVGDKDWEDVLAYSAQVLSNLAHFKSFGGTKFVPRVNVEAFEKVVSAAERKDDVRALWEKTKEEIYALSPVSQLVIGKPSAGHLSNYYPSDPAPSDEQVDEVQNLCDQKGISTLNTRLIKVSDKELVLKLASTGKDLPSSYPAELESQKLGFKVRIEGGDFAASLAKVNQGLLDAAKFAGDDNRSKMLHDYEASFRTGNLEKHKDGSRKWVKDQGPVVESYIGFIESYVDPFGARAEFEAFVAVVNKEVASCNPLQQSKKFGILVDKAPHLIQDLPWGKSFEVDTFQRPDFTALEILSFATGGIPAGINIPNYHDVREQDGFKNVSLVNILAAKAAGEVLTFIAPEEREMYEKWVDRCFEVQVCNHEVSRRDEVEAKVGVVRVREADVCDFFCDFPNKLLGHGTGKLLQQRPDGSLNFDRDNLVNPLTNKPIESWYQPGETYGSRIGPVSSAMEECRAEAVALYLASNREIQEIFEIKEQKDRDDLVYFTFLSMARAGVKALEWYDPVTGRHGQAHMEARHGITNWLMKHGIVSLEKKLDEQGQLVDAFARVNREACLGKGKKVMGDLLLHLQILKSTGDGPGATSFFKKLTTPSRAWIDELRPLVLSSKFPRKIFVQPNTVVGEGGEVELREYEVSLEGVVRSFVERGL